MNFNAFFEEASKLKAEKNPVLTQEQTQEYSKVFTRLAGKSPTISYEKMVDFMRSSFLRNEYLTEVLLIGLKNPLEQIGQRQFNCLMKLIACKQAGHKLSEALLYDEKIPRGLVKMGEQVVFQLTKEEIAEYETQSFFCKNKSEIANFTKAPMEVLNQVVQITGLTKKEEMFSTEQTTVILHLMKKAQIYNIPRILPAHLAKYLKTEHAPVVPTTPTSTTGYSASFLQLGQPSNPPQTNRSSMPNQPIPPSVSNRDLPIQSPSTSAMHRISSQTTSSSATASLFGFSNTQPREAPKLVQEASTPTSAASNQSPSFNLFDAVTSTPTSVSSPPAPINPYAAMPSAQHVAPSGNTAASTPMPQNIASPLLGTTNTVAPTPTVNIPPSPANAKGYDNPFAQLESVDIAPAISPQQVIIPPQVNPPQSILEAKVEAVDPLNSRIEQLGREKKHLETEIVNIRRENDLAVEQLKNSNNRLRELLEGTLHMNRQLLKEKEESNALIKQLAIANERTIVDLVAAQQEYEATMVAAKLDQTRLLTSIRSSQEGLVSLVRSKYEQLKQSANSTNRELADLAKSIDDSKLHVGIEFASTAPSDPVISHHEIKTDLKHDDTEQSWKVFESNMHQQPPTSTTQWPPLEL